MFSPQRRAFMKRAAQAGLVAGLGDFAFLSALPSLSAQQVQVPRERVRLNADIEPLVALIEDTARERLLEVVADRVRGGTSYQELLAALMLAGVRGIQPRPVGFQFHAVMVSTPLILPPWPARTATAGFRCSWPWTTSKPRRAAIRSRTTAG